MNQDLVTSHSRKSISNLLMLNGKFVKKFIIPEIQRDYIMGSDTGALSSILTSMIQHMRTGEPMKFSTLILFEDGNDLFVYDGQQRITTCFVIIASIVKAIGKRLTISNYFNYSGESREHVIKMIDSISLSDKLPEYCDTSTYSIDNAVKYLLVELAKLNIVDLYNLHKFVINSVVFNAVFKSNSHSDVEQYFIDVNEGVALSKIDIFKSELVDHIITNYYGKELVLYIENHVSGVQLYVEDGILLYLFFIISMHYRLRTDLPFTSINLLTKGDIVKSLNFFGYLSDDWKDCKVGDSICKDWESGKYKSVNEFIVKYKPDLERLLPLFLGDSMSKIVLNSMIKLNENFTIYSDSVKSASIFTNNTEEVEYLLSLASIVYNNGDTLRTRDVLISRLTELFSKYPNIVSTSDYDIERLTEDLFSIYFSKGISSIDKMIAMNIFYDEEDYGKYISCKTYSISFDSNAKRLAYKYNLPVLVNLSDKFKCYYKTLRDSEDICSKDSNNKVIAPTLRFIMQYLFVKQYSTNNHITLYECSKLLRLLIIYRELLHGTDRFPEIIRDYGLIKLEEYGRGFKSEYNTEYFVDINTIDFSKLEERNKESAMAKSLVLSSLYNAVNVNKVYNMDFIRCRINKSKLSPINTNSAICSEDTLELRLMGKDIEALRKIKIELSKWDK